MSRRKPVDVGELLPRTIVFFPHSRKDYGSERAATAERVIKTAWPGCELIDPRHIDWKQLTKEEGDSTNADELVVRDCQVVVGLEHQDHIGRGVYGGLQAGLRLGRQVYVVRGTELLPVAAVEVVDPEDWAVRFGRVVLADSCGVSR